MGYITQNLARQFSENSSCGLLVLTLRGGTTWGPMGWTVIGGLMVSTFLTLIVVPVLYKAYSGEKDPFSVHVKRKIHKKSGEMSHHDTS